MFVRDILLDKGRNVVSINPDATLTDAVQTLVDNRIGALVVLGPGGTIEGIVSERDIVRALAESGREAVERSVSAFMSRDIKTCAESDSVEALMEIMTHRRLRHLPVIEGGQLCGIVSIGDVVKIRIAETVQEAESLRGYIAAG